MAMTHNPRDHVKSTEERFGTRVRALREATGMPQAHIARVLTVSHGLKWDQSTVARTEAAQRPIRLIEAAALAEVFGVPLGDLLDDFREGKGTAVQVKLARRAAISEVELMLEHLERRRDELKGATDER